MKLKSDFILQFARKVSNIKYYKYFWGYYELNYDNCQDFFELLNTISYVGVTVIFILTHQTTELTA